LVFKTFKLEMQRIEVITGRRFNEADGEVIFKSLNGIGTTDSEFKYAVDMLESIDIPKRDLNLLSFFKSRVLEIRRQLKEQNAAPVDPAIKVTPEQSKFYGLTVAAAGKKLMQLSKEDYYRWRDWFNKKWFALSGDDLTEFLKMQYKSFNEFAVSHETTPGLREKYGLSMRPRVSGFPEDEYNKLILEQESVAQYLEDHPEESEKWNSEKIDTKEYYRIIHAVRRQKLTELQKDW